MSCHNFVEDQDRICENNAFLSLSFIYLFINEKFEDLFKRSKGIGLPNHTQQIFYLDSIQDVLVHL